MPETEINIHNNVLYIHILKLKMNTQFLPITKEVTSATSFRYIEVIAVKHSGISQPSLKLRLSNSTTEFNLFLQPSQETQSYPKIDLSAIAQELPVLARTEFNRLKFSIQDTDNLSGRSDVTLELLFQ